MNTEIATNFEAVENKGTQNQSKGKPLTAYLNAYYWLQQCQLSYKSYQTQATTTYINLNFVSPENI